MKSEKKSFKAVSFKKRYKPNYDINKLRYGNAGLKFLRAYNIEYIYLFDLKKKLKFFITLRKKIFNNNM